MAYQLRITLRKVNPPIWRQVMVPGTITFEQLHQVIQSAFGWLDYHLYRFAFDSVVVAEDDPYYTAEELWGAGMQVLEPATPIAGLLDQHDSCLYEYDFGDSWEHDILIEKRLKESRKYAVPICRAGARSRPPEDVGGVGGYAHFLATIRDPKNPERNEMLDWAQKDTGGRLFDPEYFYLNEVNRRLAHALEDTPEAASQLLSAGRGLVGTLKAGEYGPIIQVEGQSYSWERLGVLVSMLGEDVPVSIKVGRRKGGRR